MAKIIYNLRDCLSFLHVSFSANNKVIRKHEAMNRRTVWSKRDTCEVIELSASYNVKASSFTAKIKR
jgi:hypothetical protein